MLKNGSVQEDIVSGKLFRDLLRYDRLGYLMSCSTPGQDVFTESGLRPAEGEGPGLVQGHAYTLLRVCETRAGHRLLELRNPWGRCAASRPSAACACMPTLWRAASSGMGTGPITHRCGRRSCGRRWEPRWRKTMACSGWYGVRLLLPLPLRVPLVPATDVRACGRCTDALEL